uniref:Uncharacterized protein n=1 Tax=Panagrolaimus sp. PS1159 TaxID=55785 RepID=A0AC35GNG4_9BILA
MYAMIKEVLQAKINNFAAADISVFRSKRFPPMRRPPPPPPPKFGGRPGFGGPGSKGGPGKTTVIIIKKG